MNKNDGLLQQQFQGRLLALLLVLYVAQGLPSGILAHGLPVLLREYQVGLFVISLTKLLAIPWALKFLWAPAVDALWSPAVGKARSWWLLTQLLIIVSLLIVAWVPVKSWLGHLYGLFALLFFLNILAATQDIATDGFAVRRLEVRWRGLGNSVQVVGYKLGMVVGGAGWLVAIELLGWFVATLIIAGLSLAIFVVMLRVREPRINNSQAPSVPPYSGGLLDKSKGGVGAASVLRQGRTQFQFLVLQPAGCWWLLLLMVYKVGDALASPMIKPLYVDLGLGLTNIASLMVWASAAGLLGALTAGILLSRISKGLCLWVFGLLQGLGILAYGALLLLPDPHQWLWPVALFEQWSDGLSTVVLFSWMMSRCREGHEATDFTLQASIVVIAAGCFALLGGAVASMASYQTLFWLAGVLGVVVVIPCWGFLNADQRSVKPI